MKFVFLSSAEEEWGAEKSMAVLVDALQELGHETVLVSSNSTLVARWRTASRDAVFSPHLGRVKNLRSFAREVSALEKQTEDDPDRPVYVVFSVDLIPLVFLCGRAGDRFIVDLHDYLPSARGRALLRVFTRRYRGVVTISRFAATQLAARTRRAVLTRPVVDPGRATSLQSLPRVGIVGRVDPDKNIEFALEALNAMSARLITEVRGAGSQVNSIYAEHLRKSALALYGDRVLFTGRLSGDEVMNGLSVLLVCNPREAMGRTVLEAQLRGVPVVVPDRGGASELVEDGVTGFSYEADDPSSLARAIHRALAADKMVSERARAKALEVTDGPRYAARYVEAVQSFL